MTAANLATQTAEALTPDRRPSALRLFSARDEFEEIDIEEMRRRWRHRNIARTMSLCGKRLAPALSSPASVDTSSDELKEIFAILATGMVLGLCLAAAWCGITASLAPTPAPQVETAASLLPARITARVPAEEEAAVIAPREDAIGSARLRYNRHGRGHLIVPVSVNGVIGRFILDTGAPNTMISAAFAARANVKTLPHIAFEMTTWATFHVNSGEADTIALGDARVAHMYVSVYTSDNDWPDRNADGLLGLSFLEHFHMQLDRGVLELTPLAAKRD
jgi:predicted aspartyl protease